MEPVSLVLTGQAIKSLRESDFDTCSAVGEVIDNSIQAGAKSIHVIAKEEELPARGRRKLGQKIIKEIAFGDDGHGMNSETLHRCMQLGYSTRYDDRTGIGRFGVGMTLGAINQCLRIEVYSREPDSSSWLYTHVDLQEVVENPFIPPPEAQDLPDQYAHLVGDNQGTLLIWTTFDRTPQQLADIQHWIARTYRKFIGELIVCDGKVIKNDNPVLITINNDKVEAFDPLYVIPNRYYSDVDTATLFEPIDVPIPVPPDTPVSEKQSVVRIHMSLTPEEWRLEGSGRAGRSELAEKLHISDNEGFSVMRARREVFYDAMPHFEPKVHNDGYDRWWSAEVLFEPALDLYFSIRNIKRGAMFVRELREKIQEKMKPTILYSRRVVEKRFRDSKQKHIHNDKDVTTEHTPAEKVVKTVGPTPGKAGADKTPEDKKQELEEILQSVVDSEEALEAWTEKIDSQPCTIVDNEGTRWKGSTFLDIHPQGGRTIIEYNMAHEFFMFVYGTINELINESLNDPSDIVETAKKLKVAIDLLFMAYAQAENLSDPDHEQRVGDTLEMLRNNWGTFLRQYVRTFENDG